MQSQFKWSKYVKSDMAYSKLTKSTKKIQYWPFVYVWYKVIYVKMLFGLTQHTLLQAAWTPGIQTRGKQICSALGA